MTKTKTSDRVMGPKAEQFALAWVQAAMSGKSLAELADELGMTERAASQRASMYRNKQGLPLPKFAGGRESIDWASLKNLVASLVPAVVEAPVAEAAPAAAVEGEAAPAVEAAPTGEGEAPAAPKAKSKKKQHATEETATA